MKKNKKWVIYDGRYHFDDGVSQIVEVCDSLAEAKQAMKNHPKDYVIVEELFEDCQ